MTMEEKVKRKRFEERMEEAEFESIGKPGPLSSRNVAILRQMKRDQEERKIKEKTKNDGE